MGLWVLLLAVLLVMDGRLTPSRSACCCCLLVYEHHTINCTNHHPQFSRPTNITRARADFPYLVSVYLYIAPFRPNVRLPTFELHRHFRYIWVWVCISPSTFQGITNSRFVHETYFIFPIGVGELVERDLERRKPMRNETCKSDRPLER